MAPARLRVGVFTSRSVFDIIILMLHPSRIFSFLLIVFIAVVAFSLSNNFLVLNLFWPLIFSTIAAVLFWKIKILRYSLLLVSVILLGLFRVQAVSFENSDNWIGKYIGSEGKFEVRVVEEPRVTGKSQQITARATGTRGNIQISTNQFPVYHFGDTIKVEGKITDLSPESEQYRGYFKTQEIYAFTSYPKIEKIGKRYPLKDDWYFKIRKPLISLRLRYESVIGKILPEPEAGLLSGIILGSKASLSDEFLLWLSVTGTIHIIALSGYNITIVAEFMRIIARSLSARMSFWLPVFGIISFVLATGLSSSVIRAAIMGVVMLSAKRSGRQADGVNSILFASAVMIYVNPMILLYDVGFQLSFTAVSGILFLAPKIEKYFSFFGDTIGPVVCATLAAQLFSWPVVSYYFGVVSLIFPIANILIVPLIPFVMLAGFAAASVGLISVWLGKILGLVSWVILSYFVKIIKMLANVKYAAGNYKISSGYVICGYYLLLLDVLVLISKRKKLGPKKII